MRQAVNFRFGHSRRLKPVRLLSPGVSVTLRLSERAQRVASYSAGRDIASESELTTGTNSDIAATDQIRPIVTTTAIIPAIHARICIPSTS